MNLNWANNIWFGGWLHLTQLSLWSNPVQWADFFRLSVDTDTRAMCYLFSLHVNSHVSLLPLCCISEVTAGLAHCGWCLKAPGLMGPLSSEVCGQRLSFHIDSDQTEIACFFHESCLDMLACDDLLSISIRTPRSLETRARAQLF